MESPSSLGNSPDVTGLTDAEVAASRALHGENVLTPPERTPWWKLYLEKFDDPVIRILIVAALIAVAAGVVDGAYTEGIGIFCAIILSTLLAFLNEFKAAREFELLDKSSDETPVRVLRHGQHTSVARCEVVVGDIVTVEAGQEIAADGDVLNCVDLSIDESRMTGESEPVAKSSERVPPDGADGGAYPAHSLLRGTIVSEGYGTMRVTEVGDRTEAGKTARAATEDDEDVTPLSVQLTTLARFIGVAGFSAAVILFAILIVRGTVNGEIQLTPPQWRFSALVLVIAMLAGVRIWLPIVFDALGFLGVQIARSRISFLRPGWIANVSPFVIATVVFAGGYLVLSSANLLPVPPQPLVATDAAREFLRIFMVAVTVIVVAVPEGLAMSVTLCLAYSVRRMAAANNLVRRMHACETIGAATVICSDKTGTLTLNEMRVIEAQFPSMDSEQPSSRVGRDLVFQAIAANSTADLAAPTAARRVLGNPTEGALLLWIESIGGDYNALRQSNAIIKRLPFSTEHKFMCSLIEARSRGGRVVHIKGAPEVVLERCETILTAEGPEPLNARREALDETLRAFQLRGMRTLGFAFKLCDDDAGAGSDLKQLAEDLTWLGFVAIQDPVRPEAPDAIRACQRAGIAVKIVTGDNANTAREIARQIGLWSDHETAEALVNGPDFAAMTDAQARAAGLKLKILARCSPHDKLRLVKLLKAAGEVVAVTGDGANDAPALNHASVGLSMGKSGTASAREASDIVLLDDSFSSIVSAIKWGRSLYDNIQRFIVFQLTINAAALGLMLLGPFVGVKLPLTVPQMLWINLIMDTFAALALASEPPHDSVMSRAPRTSDAFIITRSMALDILTTGALFLAALLALIFCFKRDGEFDTHESTIVFTVMVLLQFWNLFNARCFGRTASALRKILSNRGFTLVGIGILVGQFVIVQWGGAVFRTQPLSALEWGAIFGATSIILWIGEIKRAWQRRHVTHMSTL